MSRMKSLEVGLIAGQNMRSPLLYSDLRPDLNDEPAPRHETFSVDKRRAKLTSIIRIIQ
jgi:hypothetical protein